MYQWIKEALKPYKIGNASLVIESELHGASWNNDLHYKIVADGKAYSARFIKNNRSPNKAFGEISNDILKEQTKFCTFLVNKQIKFMRLFPVSEDRTFTFIEWENEVYRFILFEWIEGQDITQCDEYMAEEIGKVARQFHDVSSLFHSTVFLKTSHLVGYSQFVENLREKINTPTISPANHRLIEEYLEEIQSHIVKAKTDHLDFIIQSDLNPLNIIWDENKKTIGIVDFESIGYCDRVEGLAWLIKWYSRTEGIHSSEMSPLVAQAFLKGYGSDDFLSTCDLERLQSLIWLSGCINWNFVQRTINILDTNNDHTLKRHI